MSGKKWLSVGLLGLAGLAGGAFLLQRQEGAALRREIDLLRPQEAELATLRAEHERLRGQQLPAAELERLRSDRSALIRLRAEIEQMKERAEKTGRTSASGGR